MHFGRTRDGTTSTALVAVALCLLFSGDLAAGEPADGPPAADRDPLLIRDARIVDVEAETVRRGALRIEDGRIAEVLPSAPSEFDGRELDAGGGWVIPGLYDMHVHSSSNKTPTYEERPPLGTDAAARAMLYVGVTGYLDLFGPPEELFRLRAAQEAGEWTGADLHAAGPILTAPGGHGTQFSADPVTLTSPAQARAAVDSLARHEPDVVKLVYNPRTVERTSRLEASIDRPTMRAIARRAATHDLKTVAHIGSWQGAYAAADAGVDALTHTPRGAVPDSVIDRMRAGEVAWIPTLAVHTELPRLVTRPDELDAPLLRAVTDSALRASYRDAPEKLERVARKRAGTRASYLDRLRTLHEAGVPVLAGTDAGNAAVFQGVSLHRELELYVEGGMSAWEALRSATTRAADFLGEESGLQEGDPASLVILDGSPVEDIENTRSIRRVVHDGVVVDRADLLADTGLGASGDGAGGRPAARRP